MNAMVKAPYLSAFLFFRASLSLSSFCTRDEGGEWESQLSFVFAFCDFIEVAGLVGRYMTNKQILLLHVISTSILILNVLPHFISFLLAGAYTIFCVLMVSQLCTPIGFKEFLPLLCLGALWAASLSSGTTTGLQFVFGDGINIEGK
jgi:hypothetical protein